MASMLESLQGQLERPEHVDGGSIPRCGRSPGRERVPEVDGRLVVDVAPPERGFIREHESEEDGREGQTHVGCLSGLEQTTSGEALELVRELSDEARGALLDRVDAAEQGVEDASDLGVTDVVRPGAHAPEQRTSGHRVAEIQSSRRRVLVWPSSERATLPGVEVKLIRCHAPIGEPDDPRREAGLMDGLLREGMAQDGSQRVLVVDFF